MSDISTRTPEEVLEHHIKHLNSGDLEGTLIDYAQDAVIVNMHGCVRGLKEIREFFKNSINNALPPETKHEMLFKHVVDDIGYIVWKADSPYVKIPFGTDTFIIKDGLIVKQTFAGQIIEK